MYSKKETIKVKLAELKPHPKNPKLHNDELIEKSIGDLGYAENIVIDENNVILSGHGRVKALVKKGEQEQEAIRITGWTEEEKEKYLLLANQSTILGGFDEMLLKDFSGDILDYSGLDSDILIEPDKKDDMVPENVPPVAKLGDLWALGRHRLLCGDATKIEDVERLMDGKKADMVFTDPPYKMAMGGKGCFVESTRNVKKRIDNIINFDPSVLSFLPSMGIPSFYICTSKDAIPDYFKIFEGYNFNILVWCKTNPIPFTSGTFLPDIEYILFFGDKGKYIWNNSLKPTDIYKKYYISKKLAGREGAGDLHPTMKPVELIQNRIMISSNKEGIVLDLFGGSGSTLIACEKTNRICYMSEIDPHYVDVIIKRWEDFSGLKAEKL